MNFTEFKLKERDRDNFEKGFLLAPKVFKLLNEGHSISQIAKECNISENLVKKILE